MPKYGVHSILLEGSAPAHPDLIDATSEDLAIRGLEFLKEHVAKTRLT